MGKEDREAERLAKRIQIKSDRVRESARTLETVTSRVDPMLKRPENRRSWTPSKKMFLSTTPDEILKTSKKKKKRRKPNVRSDQRYQKSRVARSGRSPKPSRSLQEAHPNSYGRYLKSGHWRNFRDRYYKLYPKECAVCKTRLSIHLHHRTYARLGQETMEDVVALCEAHHSAVHQYHGKNKHLTLEQATDAWLAGCLASMSKVA